MPSHKSGNGRDLETLSDMVRSADAIVSHVKDVTEREFANDQILQGDILWRISIIGEAVKRLSKSLKDRYPEIPWQAVRNMRNLLVHEYDQIDLETVWEVVRRDIPELLIQVKKIIDKEFGDLGKL